MYGLKPSSKTTRSQEDSSFQIHVGQSQALPFLPTTVHPFQSMEELNLAKLNDPFGLSSYNKYRTSEHALRQAFKKRSLQKILVEGQDYSPLKVNQRMLQYGSMHHYQIDAQIMSGVVSLDHEMSVWDVKCHADNVTVEVDFSDYSHTAAKWVPGTKMFIGSKWAICFNEEKFSVHTILSRQVVESEGKMLKVKFQTRGANVNDLFLHAQVKYFASPSVTKAAEKNFQDLFTKSRSSPINSRAVQYGYTKRLPSIGFNYDDTTNAAKEQLMNLYENSNGVKLVCENCYTALNSEFRVEFEVDFGELSFTKVEATIGGTWQTKATLRASITKTFFYDKPPTTLWKGAPISFFFTIFIVPVSVSITPTLKYSFSAQITATEYVRSFEMSYTKSIGYGYTNTGGYNSIVRGDDITFSSTSPGITLTGEAVLQLALIPGADISVGLLGLIPLATIDVGVVPRLNVQLNTESIIESLSSVPL